MELLVMSPGSYVTSGKSLSHSQGLDCEMKMAIFPPSPQSQSTESSMSDEG